MLQGCQINSEIPQNLTQIIITSTLFQNAIISFKLGITSTNLTNK
jgi:hypothetical protein